MFYVFCTLLYVDSSFAIILMGKSELVALLVCLPILVSCDGCVAFPCGAMGLSAVCDFGNSRSYSLTIFGIAIPQNTSSDTARCV